MKPKGQLVGALLIIGLMCMVVVILMTVRSSQGSGQRPLSADAATAQSQGLLAVPSEDVLVPRHPVLGSGPQMDPANSSAALSARSGTASLLIHVLCGEGGVPVMDAHVRVWCSGAADSDAEVEERVTDAAGVASFPSVYQGRLRVTADRGVSSWLDVKAGDSKELWIMPSDSRSIAGRVASSEGGPISGAEIVLSNPSTSTRGFSMLKTGTNGDFRLECLDVSSGISARALGFAASPVVPVTGEEPIVIILQPHDTASLLGRVVSEENAPVVGAQVLIAPALRKPLFSDTGTRQTTSPDIAVRTDSHGVFEIDSLPLDPIEIRILAVGFVRLHRRLSLNPNDHSPLILRLERGARVTGIVHDVDGNALSGVYVYAQPASGMESIGVQTGADGRFEFQAVPIGEVFLHAECEDHRSGSCTAIASVMNAVPCVIVVNSGIVVRGKLLRSDQTPIDGWLVGAAAPESPGMWSTRSKTDKGGEFVLRNCPQGDFVIEVHPSEGWRFPPLARQPMTATSNRDIVVVLTEDMLPTAFVSGRLVDQAGTPLPLGHVGLSRENQTTKWLEPVQAQTGTFSVGPIPAGDYSLHCEAEGYVPIDDAVLSIHSHEMRDVGLQRLQAASYFRGFWDKNVHTDERPYEVLLRDALGKERVILSDGGVFRSGPVLPGLYTARWCSGTLWHSSDVILVASQVFSLGL